MAKQIDFPTIEHLIEKIDDLPTLPTIVNELSKVIADPMSSTSEVEDIMERDQSLTAKVLKLVNSAYYAIPGGVKSLSRAIAYLGFDTVHQLVLTATIFQSLEHVESEDFNLNEFWKHSIGTAMAAETLAKIVGYKNPPDLFTCGLVHDIGKVVYLFASPEAFKFIVDEAKQKHLSLDEAESILGVPRHAHVGHLLAVRWNLPVQIQNSIRYHHDKEIIRRKETNDEMNQIIDIVYLANLFVHGLNFGSSGHNNVQAAPRAVFDRLSLNPKGLAQISKQINTGLLAAEAFLRVLSNNRGSKAA